jgi:aspartyl/glutamyl-tRNA(Asn/Gln) amidotransferase C subunit
VLGYFERLDDLDLDGVEPMSHVIGSGGGDEGGGGEGMNRLDLDEERTPMPNEALMRMAPAKMAPFVRVPKVLGEG